MKDNIITAARIPTSIDLGLKLIEILQGRELSLRVAEYINMNISQLSSSLFRS